MKKFMVVGVPVLALMGAITVVSPAKALVMAPAAALPDRVAQAKCIVLGKVTAIEEKTVPVKIAPGAAAAEYQVAVVQISDPILGAKGLTHVRVGFIPPTTNINPRTGKPIVSRTGPNLMKDQEVCLFLTPIKGESIYVLKAYNDVIDKKGTGAIYDRDVAQIRRMAKYVEDPMAGLKAKDYQDRLSTVAMLLARYRTIRGTVAGGTKTEPIDAEESRLILQTLAETQNWTLTTVAGASPRVLFNKLGLTAQDGWVQPKTVKDFPEAAKKWLSENADKYRIKRFVAAGKAEEK